VGKQTLFFEAAQNGCVNESAPLAGVVVLDTWQAVERVSDCWRGWQADPNGDSDFFRFIVEIRPECENPYIVCVEKKGTPQALLLGRTESSAVPIRIGYLNLVKLQLRLITFIQGGVLGHLEQQSSDELVKLILHRLAVGDADAAYFSHIRQDTALAASLKKVPGLFRRDTFTNVQAHRSLTIPNSVDSFYARLPSKTRKNYKRKAKRLMETFGQNVDIRCFRRPDDLDLLFREVDQIANATYQRALGVGFADTPEMRGRMQLAASKGWLRAFVLYLNQKPAAFWIGSRYRNKFFGDFVGYDSAYANHSPGMYLMLQSMESFCQETGPERVTEVDFGLGDAPYKQELATDCWTEESLYLYSPRRRGIALNLSRTFTDVLDRAGRTVLRRLGLEHSLKTTWRKRLVRKEPISNERDNSDSA
jgi:hypothetical protein